MREPYSSVRRPPSPPGDQAPRLEPCPSSARYFAAFGFSASPGYLTNRSRVTRWWNSVTASFSCGLSVELAGPGGDAAQATGHLLDRCGDDLDL
jgi:hypothetical protein